MNLPDDAEMSIDLVAFDLDDTLTESKSPMEPEMADALRDLLELRPVCIISGGRFEQFDAQVLSKLPSGTNLADLHLMPTCGTRYLRFRDGNWVEVYAHDLTAAEKDAAIASLERRAKELSLWETDGRLRGDRIEDRGSQITFSALGQRALVADKKAWDPDGAKREALRAAVAADLPNLEVRAGGSTSIDITRRGIDKAYGMASLAEQSGFPIERMLFIGDRLEPGGNDHPVIELGVPVRAVTGPHDTIHLVRHLVRDFVRDLRHDNNASEEA